MANSKSNIYPIQLQGAELNLNKLDAEIKQYSGFNKNNSPFVGGCLSNVFHKEEQITGGNAENTYIDENGDVYQVTTEGLFKNDEKILNLEEAEFFDAVNLGRCFPVGTVYVYDEETYIYIKNSGYYYHSGKVDVKVFEFTNPSLTINDYEFVDFQIKKVTISGREYDIAGALFQNRRSTDFVRILPGLSLYVISKKEDGTLDNTFNIGTGNFDDFDYTALYSFVMKTNGDSYSNFKIAILTKVYAADCNNFLITFNGSQLTLNTLPVTKTDGQTTSQWGGLLAYRFTDKNLIVCNFYNIYSNRNINNIPFKVSYNIDWEHNKVILDVPAVVYTSNTLAVSHGKSIIKSWGIVSQACFDNATIYTIDDDITSFGTIINGDCCANLGSIINDVVLINNNLASGIALPGGHILASEWNSVDLDYIFFGDNTDEWKNNKYVCMWKDSTSGDWYKLIKSTPKLTVCYNQIVINCNSIFNSYRVTDGRVLCFAPAWNNRRPNYKGTQSNTTSYMATAINEYNLGDNASILLNPVLVNTPVKPANSEFDKFRKDIFNVIGVDIFIGDTQVEYQYTQLLPDNRFFQNSNLEDLLFPSDTNGNIQMTPSVFAKFFSSFGNDVFVREGSNTYQLSRSDNQPIMSYYLGTLIEGLDKVFILQGQYYGIINKQIFSIQFNNGVVASMNSIVSVENLQFVGNTPYEALFYSKTNRCLYSFTGANVLNQKQLVDKVSEVRNYLYNPATQTVFLITDIGVLFYGLFGMFLLEYTDITNIFLLDNGIVLSDDNGNYKYIKYYLDEGDEDYTKENIRLETCFYGMNNEVVTINDCLYFRLFSEEHEEGDLKVKATTISLKGRQTEETTFKIKASDWDKITHTIYLRYQPKTQRGLGVSFSIDSPFKIASMSVGSQPDAVLVDRVSKGAITAPSVTTNNNEW